MARFSAVSGLFPKGLGNTPSTRGRTPILQSQCGGQQGLSPRFNLSLRLVTCFPVAGKGEVGRVSGFQVRWDGI